jgi:AcrR family transcriptional regulator
MTNPADYQTDPTWAEKMGLGKVAASYTDGRHARATTTKRDILAACRRLMADGDFRPSMEAISALSGRSTRSGYEHFRTLDALHTQAVLDKDTHQAILECVGGHELTALLTADMGNRLVRALVIGRISP